MSTRTTTYALGLPFVADPATVVVNKGHQIDWDALDESYRMDAKTITMSATAASGGATLTVSALPCALPVGSLLYFGAAGEYAKVATAAASGATTVIVDALEVGIESADTATFSPNKEPKKLRAGTIVGDLAGSGKLRPRVGASANPAIGILAEDAYEGADFGQQNGVAVIVGGVIYENLLPYTPKVSSKLPAGVRCELVDHLIGSADATATAMTTPYYDGPWGFHFQQYTSSIA